MSAGLSRKLQQAERLLRASDAAGAASLCEQVLRQAPRNPDALYLLGITRLSMGLAREALAPLSQALAADPHNGAALEHFGLAHLMCGQFAEAHNALAKAAQYPSAPASVFMRLGIALLEQGRPSESLVPLRKALALDPQSVDCRLNLGRALAGSGDITSAREHFHGALRLAPEHAEAAFNLGVIAQQQGELAEARRWYEQALAQSPGSVDGLINLGIVLQNQTQLDEAAGCLERALRLDPENALALSELGHTRALQGQAGQAREHYLAALRIAPEFATAHEGLASVCVALGRMGEAIPHLRSTIAATPENSGAVAALARALYEVGQLDEAQAQAQRAIEMDPHSGAAYATLANLHFLRGDLARAIETLEHGYTQTKLSGLLGILVYYYRQACDWAKWQPAWNALAQEIERSAALGSPFWMLCEPTSAEQQLRYARRWAGERFQKIAQPVARKNAGKLRAPARPRIGYLSSDLHEHATAYLIAEVLEHHDRHRFEVFAYSYGPEDRSAMRQRLRSACEHFVDIAREPDDLAAHRIANDEIDILVDLKGYTMGDRLTIMAHRPCAIQVTWLGYPGTTGASFIDYLIADSFVIPSDAESFYSERIVRMPHCYQPNDRQRAVAEPLHRADYGLPETAFVFCCFNQTYKITPEVFAVWIELLRIVPNSVLWIFENNGLAKRNLLECVQAQGIDAQRLVFAPRLPNAQHLARYRVADLALDTYPYTSHTT